MVLSFLDFPGPAALPDYLHVEAFTKSLFQPFSVVTNAVETTASLALIDYLTNEILIIGRITFFNQTYSRI